MGQLGPGGNNIDISVKHLHARIEPLELAVVTGGGAKCIAAPESLVPFILVRKNHANIGMGDSVGQQRSQPRELRLHATELGSSGSIGSVKLEHGDITTFVASQRRTPLEIDGAG